LWFLSKLEGSSATYNMPLALRLSGPLDASALVSALERIVARHESLRTRFVEREGVAYQVVDDEGCFAVAEERLDAGEDLRSICSTEACKAFDLSVDGLFRARLLSESEDEHVLLATMHHSVSDGWSIQVFFRELVELYRAYSEGREPALLPLPIQYADLHTGSGSGWWVRSWTGSWTTGRGNWAG
jgi:hypothetical protein